MDILSTISTLSSIVTLQGWWNKRKHKFHGEPVIIDVKKSQEATISQGADIFVPLEITFTNPNPFPVILTEVALTNVLAGIITMDVVYEGKRILTGNNVRLLDIAMKIKLPPATTHSEKSITTGTPEFEEMFYISQEAIQDAGQILDFRFTFQYVHPKDPKRKERTLDVHVPNIVIAHGKYRAVSVTVPMENNTRFNEHL